MAKQKNFTDEEVVALYKVSHSGPSVAEKIGISVNSIYRILHRNNIKTDGGNKQKYSNTTRNTKTI